MSPSASTSDSTVSSSSPSAPLVLPQRPTSTPFPQVPPDLVGDDGETSAVKGRVSISRRIQDPSKRRVPFHQIPMGKQLPPYRFQVSDRPLSDV
jgi:hypothetical protein